jgi:hypothetical protein
MEFLLWRLDRILCKGCIPVSSSGRGTILPPQVEASRVMADINSSRTPLESIRFSTVWQCQYRCCGVLE